MRSVCQWCEVGTHWHCIYSSNIRKSSEDVCTIFERIHLDAKATKIQLIGNDVASVLTIIKHQLIHVGRIEHNLKHYYRKHMNFRCDSALVQYEQMHYTVHAIGSIG